LITKYELRSKPGAFVAAPVGGFLFAVAAFILRISFLWLWARIKSHRFDAFDKPEPRSPLVFVDEDGEIEQDVMHTSVEAAPKGKFF